MIYESTNIEELKKLGNFSKYISADLITRGLVQAEIGILRKWMGLKAVAEFNDYPDEIKQNIHKSLALLANAWVMKNSTFTTRSGAVEKQNSAESKVLSSAELSRQASQLRIEAMQIMKHTEELIVEQGLPPFEWSKEDNILGLWFQSF